MIVFELTMPNRGSWNDRWTGEKQRHFVFKRNHDVPKEVIGKNFIYNWDDGWTACVQVSKQPSDVVRKLQKISAGFCGYTWMVDSIIKKGKIETPEKNEHQSGGII